MHLSLSCDSLNELSGANVHSTVTVTLTFDVDSVSEHGGPGDNGFHISGDVKKCEVVKIAGESGLDPNIEYATEELRRMAFRTHGTMA